MPLLLLASGLQLAGCATSPATGSTIFTGGMTPQQEARIGADNHSRIVKAFGGEYGSPELRRYVASIGRLLASTSELPALGFSFTVLDSDKVNAFAVPGGYVYVTRGLLALAGNEAELAAVLAHEIGHVTARHGARQHGQTLVATVGAALGQALGAHLASRGRLDPSGQRLLDDLAGKGALGVLRSFSREHEHESDELGIRYLARSGYDPGAMARFLGKIRDWSRLQARMRGASPDRIDRFDYLATHPAPLERVRRAERIARAANVPDPIAGADVYLSKISGITFGGSREQGYVRGRDFLHPTMRFGFRLPPGFSVFNSPDAVAAFGPGDARLVLDLEPKPYRGTMAQYVRSRWFGRLGSASVQPDTVNGLEAAFAEARLRSGNGAVDARLAAYRGTDGRIFRIMIVTPPGGMRAIAGEAERTLRSFRTLSAAEAARLGPNRLEVVTVRDGDTVRSLARRMPRTDHAAELLAVLNGLDPNARLQPGTKVKLVVPDRGK